HTPYSAQGMLGKTIGWLFRGSICRNEADARKRMQDPKRLIPPAEWTPWIQAMHSTAYTWHTHVSLHVAPGAEALLGAQLAFQFASRADESRVFRDGTENLGETGRMSVIMPTSLGTNGWDGLLERTRSFQQWARLRFKLAEDLGFRPGEGPKRIFVGPMADEVSTAEELEYLIKTCAWLGCNALETTTSRRDLGLYAKLADEYGIHGYFTHPWAYGLSYGALTRPEAGLGYAETAEKHLLAKGLELFQARAEAMRSSNPWYFGHFRFGVLGDEIEDVIGAASINADPMQKGLFAEYLQRHGSKPEFFGLKDWGELRAIDYAPPSAKVVQAQKRTEQRAQAGQALAQMDTELRIKEDAKDTNDLVVAELKAAAQAEERKAAQKLPVAAEEARLYEKRLYHWTQKYRSYYYCLFYRQWSAALHHVFPEARGAVNLQANLTMGGVMWGGECNLWDLGRLNAFDSLLTEDWNSSSRDVAFGYEMVRAAARKNGQTVASLVVGHMPGARMIVHLAQGSRYLLLYLYGPIHRIGPVWGEHAPTLKDIGQTLRQAAKCEADILAARNRPCDAAILVANTSEINAAYGRFNLVWERRGVYWALLNGQVPVEAVGEEEVIEDEALKRYRVLYVIDPHVDSRAQEKIKEWVRSGGVLWSTCAGMARREYDEPSHVMDEVFGLEKRHEVEIGKPLAKKTISFNAGGRQFRFESLGQQLGSLSTGTALAQFEDGSPAIVHNKFGSGQAFLNGFMLCEAAPAAGPESRAADAEAAATDDLRRQLATVASDAGKVRTFLRAGARRQLLSWVHDGPSQSVLFLVNEGAEIKDLRIEVVLPKPANTVLSGRRGPLRHEPVQDGAAVSITLPPNEGEIIVFRW
ncbi:MAG: hypothetical protein ABSE73_23910, partial [Planctomycetota bacterium]